MNLRQALLRVGIAPHMASEYTIYYGATVQEAREKVAAYRASSRSPGDIPAQFAQTGAHLLSLIDSKAGDAGLKLSADGLLRGVHTEQAAAGFGTHSPVATPATIATPAITSDGVPRAAPAPLRGPRVAAGIAGAGLATGLLVRLLRPKKRRR